jgi:hypothetical protein
MAERHPRMILSTEGMEGSGKTRLGLTAPRPLWWLDFDFGLEGVEGDEPDERKTYDLLAAEWMPEGEARRYAQEVMRRFIADFRGALVARARSVVVDTFTAAWAGQRLARSEDKYVEMEEEFNSLIRAAYASPHTNVLLIHHMQRDWKRNQQGKPYKGETWSRDGMDGILNKVQFGIRQRYVQPKVIVVPGAPPQIAEPGRFEIDVLKCRDNVGLVGTTLPGMDFPTLCAMAAPLIDWSR